MPKLTMRHITEAMNDYDLLLFDLWGVVIEGDDTYQGVVDTLNEIIKTKDVMFLTNAPRPASIVARNLRNWHMPEVTEDMVLTSGDLAREIMQNHSAENLQGITPKIFHLGEDRNTDLLLDIDCIKTEDIEEAHILVMSLYRDEHEDVHEFNDILKRAAKRKDLLKICSNPDTTIPRHGVTRYCAGYYSSIIEKHGGEVIYTGKPKKSIYNVIFERRPNVDKDKILMIGDTFETDILGAKDSGIHSGLVLSGNCEKIHKEYEAVEEKIEAIEKHANKLGAYPTFVTKLN